VSELLHLPFKHFSSGMRARLAFSIAAHLEPDILLVDETLAVGDAAFRDQCLDKMAELARRGGIVLLVTHEPELVRRLCTSAVLLRRGRLELFGETERVLEQVGKA
jgi:ABC-type polysaccharide/polyol phosphate transport system ATPase subunit